MSSSARRRATRAHIREQGQKASRVYAKNTSDMRRVETVDKQMKVDYDAYVKDHQPIMLLAIAAWLPPVWWANWVATLLGWIPPLWMEQLFSPAQKMNEKKKMVPLSVLQRIHLAAGFPFRVFFIVIRKIISVVLVEWMLPIRRKIGGGLMSGCKRISTEKRTATMTLRRFGKELYRKEYSW